MRPCIEPECISLARQGARCPTHSQQHGAAKSRRRNQAAPPTGAAGTARTHLKKTGWGYCAGICHIGSRYRSAAELEVDHIVPLANGGTDQPHNVQLLCRSCHKAKSDAEHRARYRSQP